MLLRIALILAILAGFGTAGVAYYEFSTQIPRIQNQRDTEKVLKDTEITAHNKTKAELKKTQGDLAQTQQELSDTKSERDKALARADAQAKRADELDSKLSKANADLQDSQNEVAAYKASGLSADEVVKLNKNYLDARKAIAAVTGERDLWNRKYKAVKLRLDKYEGDPDQQFVKLPSNLKGAIVLVDPKWDFVVLNVGEDQGAVQEGEMLVSRDGKLVAKVVIRAVEKNRSVANLVPGWKLGDVFEGDVVTPAHPSST